MIGKIVGKGRTADVYEYGANKVIKLFNDRISPADVSYEHKVSCLLAETTELVPKVYGVEDVNGRRGIVFERISGETMLSMILKEPLKLRYYARRLANIQNRLHISTGLVLNKTQDVLEHTISKSEYFDENEKSKIISLLRTLPDGDTLCHGDFHPDNIIVMNGRFCVTDWMTATRGSCRFDIARTYVILRYSVVPVEVPYIKRKLLDLFKNRLAVSYLKSYGRLSGENRGDILAWELPVIAARLSESITVQEKELLLEAVRKRIQEL